MRNRKKSRKRIRLQLKKRLMTTAFFVALIYLLRRLKNNWDIMHLVSEKIVCPIHRFLIACTGKVSFSIAELVILLFGVSLISWFLFSLICLFRYSGRLRRGIGILLTLSNMFLGIYSGFCILWGVYYYGEDFRQNTGIEAREVSVDELETVAQYFVHLANQYADQVDRDTNGLYVADRNRILEKSITLYREAEKEIPGLSGPEAPVKPFYFSKLLSLADFTGFFFPFTGEANVNVDFPPSLFASTVAHEIAHQRRVAKEQEANFCAVMASLKNGDPDYCYSACLMACTYLGNALYSEDSGKWNILYSELDDRIKTDFQSNREYWSHYQTPLQEISNTVYEYFLQSYDQNLGLKSYGACTDLLVCYYLKEAELKDAEGSLNSRKN